MCWFGPFIKFSFLTTLSELNPWNFIWKWPLVRCSFLSTFRNLDFSKVLQISIWITFGINGVNITQNTLDGLFSNLEHTLVVIVLRVDWFFKVMSLDSKVKVTASGKCMIWVIFILVCLVVDTRDICCYKQQHILFYIWDKCIYLQFIFIIPCAIKLCQYFFLAGIPWFI